MSRGPLAVVLLLMALLLPVVPSRAQQNKNFQRGLQQYIKKNFAEAREHFERAIKNDSTVVKHRFFLGNTTRRLGDTLAAIRQYKRVLQLDTGHSSARKKMAEIYFSSKNWKKAQKHYARLAEANPGNFSYRFRLGISQFKRGKIDKAKGTMLKARELDPKSGPAHFYLGRILMKRGEYLNAASRFNRAIELKPSLGRYQFYRALAYFREQDYMSRSDEAWRSAEGFKKAIERDFATPKTRFMYGNSLLNRGLYYLENDRVEEGVGLLKKSIRQFRRVVVTDWKASNAFHNMGVAYLGIGKLDLAKRAVENGIMSEPSVPFFHDTLGEIFFRLGEFDKALESWELVKELDSDYSSHPFEPLYFERSIEERIKGAKLRR
ncbi:MAG: tetratricopeptide repeat protein [bacterium]